MTSLDRVWQLRNGVTNKVSKIEQCFLGRACNQEAKPEPEKNIDMILIPAAT